jgi:virulence-associated protein VapD
MTKKYIVIIDINLRDLEKYCYNPYENFTIFFQRESERLGIDTSKYARYIFQFCIPKKDTILKSHCMRFADPVYWEIVKEIEKLSRITWFKKAVKNIKVEKVEKGGDVAFTIDFF